jgi:hypothetical protein
MTMKWSQSVRNAMPSILGKLLLAGVLTLSAGGVSNAADIYPWNDHAKPYDFLFNGGMDIDTHQQTLLNNSAKELSGFLYVQFSGVVSKDGYRVGSHTDCSAPGASCTVGWQLRGKPIRATLVYQVEPDHPTWLVDRADIPQPGSYNHFHWSDTPDQPLVGSTHAGYLLQLEAVDTFCFVHHDALSFNAKLTCEDHANNGVIVQPGVDIATHGNIVGSYPGYGVP